MKRACEGYCGGYVRLKDIRTTPGGERFCKDCYSEWKRREYYGND